MQAKARPEVLIARGRCGKVFKGPGNLARKEFSPSLLATLWNLIFYSSPHPLSTESGHLFAYYKRKLAHSLSIYSGGNVRICDALELCKRGFNYRFINGRFPAKKDKQLVYSQIKELEQFFDAIGMPTWSFSKRNPFSGSNLILQGEKIYIIDYEQSVAIPDVKGHMGYDGIYFTDLCNYIDSNKQQLLAKLGQEQMQELEQCLQLAQSHFAQLKIKPRSLTRFEQRFSQALSIKKIEQTIEILHKEGKISAQELKEYQTGKSGELIRLAMTNLAVHCVIGLSTPAYIFTPFSALLRLLWTMANFIYYTLKGDYQTRKVHSLRVMLVAAMPLPFPLSAISNGAYLLSIMNENPQIGLAMCNNLMQEFTGKGLAQIMSRIGSKRLIKPALKAYRKLSSSSLAGLVQKAVIGRNTKKAHDVLLAYLLGVSEV